MSAPSAVAGDALSFSPTSALTLHVCTVLNRSNADGAERKPLADNGTHPHASASNGRDASARQPQRRKPAAPSTAPVTETAAAEDPATSRVGLYALAELRTLHFEAAPSGRSIWESTVGLPAAPSPHPSPQP